MRALVLSCVLSVMLAGVAAGEEFSGRVVGVTDGDTITVLAGREQRKVRLADGSSVNERMVENGWAWHYVKYSKDGRLGELEARARAARRGLWADADPVAPWEFRASGRRRGLEE